MSNWLEISNQGEIEIGAFTLMGASSKRDQEGKIGYFGSGLKYAMIFFHRIGHPIKVFSGENEIEITFEGHSFRNKEYRVMHVNGQSTSMSIDMGPDWESWHAVREVFCNAIDEGNSFHQVTDEEPWGAEGYTKFYIECSGDVNDIVNNWDQYFTDGRKDRLYTLNVNGKTIDLYPESKSYLFRKGILCVNREEHPPHRVFSYDVSDVSINESRIAVSENSAIREAFYAILSNCNEHSIALYALKNFHGSVEASQAVYAISECKFSPTVDRVLREAALYNADTMMGEESLNAFHTKKHVITLPQHFCRLVDLMYKGEIRIFGYKSEYEQKFHEVEPTQRELAMIKQCNYVWTELRLDIAFGLLPSLCPVEFHSDLSNLSEESDRILISRNLLAGSKESVIKELINMNVGSTRIAEGFLRYALTVNQFIL